MIKTSMDPFELLAKHDQKDLLRSVNEAILQLMIKADVDGLIGTGRHERADGQATCAKITATARWTCNPGA